MKGVAMGVRGWTGPLLIGAITVAGCGDDDSSSAQLGNTTKPAPMTSPPVGTSTAPGTVADNPPSAVLFEDPFDDDRNGWGVIDDPEFGSATFNGGDYVWEFTGSAAHVLPQVLGEQYDRGELDTADVVVRAEATVLAGGGVIGVFCREERDVDADWQWFEFVARDGFAAIRNADSEGNIETLAETEDVSAPTGEPIALEATCTTGNDEDTELSMTLNDGPMLTATADDPLGTGPPGLQAWTFPAHAELNVRWHEFSIHAVDN
jgi:hypothetical protein